MADPKEGYVEGVDRIVICAIDTDGNAITFNDPKEGFNSGVDRAIISDIDSNGDFAGV